MKAFIFSTAIVIIIFALTLTNGFFVQKATTDLLTKAQALQTDDSSLERLAALWDEKRFFVSITTSQDEILKIDDALAQLKSHRKQEDKSKFYEQRALLINYLVQIKSDEEISIDNVI